ncbi:hypothetical protein Bca101_024020 [Brassica carinata]
MLSFVLGLSFSSFVVGFSISFPDLDSTPTEKTHVVLVSSSESIETVLLTGESREALSIITATHRNHQSMVSLPSHFRSAATSCRFTASPHSIFVKVRRLIKTRISGHRNLPSSFYKWDSVLLLGGVSISNLAIITISFSSNEVLPIRSAARYNPTSMLRSDEPSFSDVSPTTSSIWAWPMRMSKGSSPLSSSPIIKFSKRTWPIIHFMDLRSIIKFIGRIWPMIYFVGLVSSNSSSMTFGGFSEALIRTFVHISMTFGGFTEALIRTFVHIMSYSPDLSVDSSLPLSSPSSSEERGASLSPKAFSMGSAAFPAFMQMKLSKSLTVLLSCGAVRTGPKDTTGLVSTISRGVDCLLTSHSKVTKFQLSGFAVYFSTHSSLTLNSLSFYLRGFSTAIFYVVLLYCNVRRARIISSSKCSPNV